MTIEYKAQDRYETLRESMLDTLIKDRMMTLVEKKEPHNPKVYVDNLNDCMIRLNNFSPADLDNEEYTEDLNILAYEMCRLMYRILDNALAFAGIYLEAVSMIMVNKHKKRK